MIRRKGDRAGGPISKSKLGYLKSLNPVTLWTPQSGRTDLRNVANPGTLDATLNGDAYIGGESPLGQALVLDGTGDYAEIAYDAALAPDEFTLFSIVTPTVGAAQSIVANRDGTTSGYALQIDTTGEVRLQTSSSGLATLTGVTQAASGGNYSIAATYTGGNSSIYFNGALDAGPTTKGYTPATAAATVIGALPAFTTPFTGNIALVAIFNTALTATQIARIHSDLLR